jgi:hypothetical protein
VAPIEHERAHRLADAACLRGDYKSALRLLERAQRAPGGPVGFHASLRTANRILNIWERVRRGGESCVRCQAPLDRRGNCSNPYCGGDA